MLSPGLLSIRDIIENTEAESVVTFSLCCLVYFQFYRTVVRSEDLSVDLCSGQSVAKILAYDEVVDTPACILLAGLESV